MFIKLTLFLATTTASSGLFLSSVTKLSQYYHSQLFLSSKFFHASSSFKHSVSGICLNRRKALSPSLCSKNQRSDDIKYHPYFQKMSRSIDIFVPHKPMTVLSSASMLPSALSTVAATKSSNVKVEGEYDENKNTTGTLRRSKRQRTAMISPSQNGTRHGTKTSLEVKTSPSVRMKKKKTKGYVKSLTEGNEAPKSFHVSVSPDSISSANSSPLLGEETEESKDSEFIFNNHDREIFKVVTPDSTVFKATDDDEERSPSYHQENTTLKKKLIYDTKDKNEHVGFIDLQIPPWELRPSATLTTGQCFHWRAVTATTNNNDNSNNKGSLNEQQTPQAQSAWGIHNATEWIGVLRVGPDWYQSSYPDETKDKRSRMDEDKDEEDSMQMSKSVVVRIRETPTSTLYQTLYAPSHVNMTDFLLSYFQMYNIIGNVKSEKEYISLKDLYSEWSTQCQRLQQIAPCIAGVRILNQDPWECFVSFLCSSNNNIPRITKILQSIRQTYGTKITTFDNNTKNDPEIADTDAVYYSFPSLNRLMQLASESDLRSKCGMGYRAKYLMQSMKLLNELGGERYLHELKYHVHDPIHVQESLLQFCGIGRKVADCIALFSLNQCNAIPVDVHVWDIALRDYDHNKTLAKAKSLTPTIYQQVGNIFRSRFPNKSGWAHSLLFVAELPSFRPTLPKNLIRQMDQFKEKQQSKKRAGG